MNRYVPALCVGVVLTGLGLFSDPSAWSTERQGASAVHTDANSLASLVSQYLRADSKLQEDLKERILSHPDASQDLSEGWVGVTRYDLVKPVPPDHYSWCDHRLALDQECSKRP